MRESVTTSTSVPNHKALLSDRPYPARVVLRMMRNAIAPLKCVPIRATPFLFPLATAGLFRLTLSYGERYLGSSADGFANASASLSILALLWAVGAMTTCSEAQIITFWKRPFVWLKNHYLRAESEMISDDCEKHIK